LSPSSSPTHSADRLRNDRRAGALLPERRRGAQPRPGRLASRRPVTAVRLGGRLSPLRVTG
jgi:hypothetical protein